MNVPAITGCPGGGYWAGAAIMAAGVRAVGPVGRPLAGPAGGNRAATAQVPP
jgi:hypothetical protein